MTSRIAILFVLVVSLLVTGCARGKAVGEVDLMSASATLTLSARPGDTLHFRADVAIDALGLKKEYRDSNHHRSAATDAMNRSQLTVTVRDDAGTSRSVTCPLKGTATMQSWDKHELGETGLVLSCTLPILQAGQHVVTGSVAWDPTIKPVSGTLEVRLRKAS